MTVVKKIGCDSSQVKNLVKSMVENAQQVTDVGAELTFILPSHTTPNFPDLFDTLEGTTIVDNIVVVQLLMSLLQPTYSFAF